MWGNEQDGIVSSLAPCSHDLSPDVSPQTLTLHGYVKTEITYSTSHAHHKILIDHRIQDLYELHHESSGCC